MKELIDVNFNEKAEVFRQPVVEVIDCNERWPDNFPHEHKYILKVTHENGTMATWYADAYFDGTLKEAETAAQYLLGLTKVWLATKRGM